MWFYKILKTLRVEWKSGLQCCAVCWTDGHGFEHPQMFVDTRSARFCCHADLKPEVNLRITLVRKYARDTSRFWNPGQTSPEVQTRGISNPTKRTCVLHFSLKNNQTFQQCFNSSVRKVLAWHPRDFWTDHTRSYIFVTRIYHSEKPLIPTLPTLCLTKKLYC